MIVICVDNTARKQLLVVGKEYEVQGQDDKHFRVRNEDGFICDYGKQRFKIKEEKEVKVKVKLKPCPFCDGDARMITNNQKVKVRCSLCHASTASHDSSLVVVEMWHTRSKAV